MQVNGLAVEKIKEIFTDKRQQLQANFIRLNTTNISLCKKPSFNYTKE
ncbi:hypothetical protein IX307_000886 [Bacteroides pyogenes]|nr:hypothetical protein [Bacteroides pyogenes]MBR8719581.1 hypothetical protein [Bacteroides pyogenes]MBR8786577.1 hypothetical protein [Bacteroides pyogenes]MBR8792060.1 hypothetical protein [Bacteroides pyogenes]